MQFLNDTREIFNDLSATWELANITDRDGGESLTWNDVQEKHKNKYTSQNEWNHCLRIINWLDKRPAVSERFFTFLKQSVDFANKRYNTSSAVSNVHACVVALKRPVETGNLRKASLILDWLVVVWSAGGARLRRIRVGWPY